jgi:hypothetical protein
MLMSLHDNLQLLATLLFVVTGIPSVTSVPAIAVVSAVAGIHGGFRAIVHVAGVLAFNGLLGAGIPAITGVAALADLPAGAGMPAVLLASWCWCHSCC